MNRRIAYLEDRCRDLQPIISEFQTRRSGEQLIHLYDGAKRDLSEVADSLSRLAEVVHVLAENGVRTVTPETKGVISLVQNVIAEAQESVEEAIQSESLAKLRTVAKQVGEALRQEVKRAWAEFVAANKPVRDPVASLDLFEQLGLFTEHIEEYRNAATVIEEVGGAELPNTERVELFTRAVEAYRQAEEQLASADFPDDVRDFLEATTTDGAAIADLSPAVQQWLDENDVADRFVIYLE